MQFFKNIFSNFILNVDFELLMYEIVLWWSYTLLKLLLFLCSWDFGEEGGYAQLCRFLEEDVAHYEKESSRADMPWTSVTSPYIHWGELSPRTVLHEALARGRDATKFRRKLAWRDMSYWILSMFPNMDKKSIRPQYENQWWSKDKDHLKAWQKGTGI